MVVGVRSSHLSHGTLPGVWTRASRTLSPPRTSVNGRRVGGTASRHGLVIVCCDNRTFAPLPPDTAPKTTTTDTRLGLWIYGFELVMKATVRVIGLGLLRSKCSGLGLGH